MSAFTFLQLLTSEVARMQTLHPEREGELARAHALILHGQVLPSADDPETGAVLSSDLSKTYTVNGSCSCQAGAHGKACKHQQAWKLYQYITRKVEEQMAPPEPEPLPALGEAPASANVRVTIAGRDVQLTLRGTSEDDVLARLEKVLQRYPVPEKSAAADQPEGLCVRHNVQMKRNDKNGRQWWSHRTADGHWCKGRERP